MPPPVPSSSSSANPGDNPALATPEHEHPSPDPATTSAAPDSRDPSGKNAASSSSLRDPNGDGASIASSKSGGSTSSGWARLGTWSQVVGRGGAKALSRSKSKTGAAQLSDEGED